MGLFSLSKKGNRHINNRQGFIELVNCPQGGKNCEEHRKLINKSILSAREHFIDKNFQLSIENLQIAFDKTKELEQDTCINCGKLFRQTITQSMKKMQLDLEKMSKGFFRNKRHRPSYLLANKVLNNFKRDI